MANNKVKLLVSSGILLVLMIFIMVFTVTNNENSITGATSFDGSKLSSLNNPVFWVVIVSLAVISVIVLIICKRN